jgi:hypothetical protein
MKVTRDKAVEFLPIFKAFAEGEIIQFREPYTNTWVRTHVINLSESARNYRVEPSNKYRIETLRW